MADFQAALREVEPSAIREVFVEVPDVGWDDVGGLDEVKQRLIEAVEWPLKHAAIFARAGVRPPKGVLLSGPPGCGKTLLAKAVASETRVNFISVKGPELLSKYVGESRARRPRGLPQGRQAAPCIVFFDEIDALVPARGGGDDSDERVGERVIGQFLAEMDGVEELNGVLVLGATNRPDILDPALLRPGRFDLHLDDPPARPRRPARRSSGSRSADKPHARDVSPAELAEATEGFSGAEIQAVVALAALAAVREAIESALRRPTASADHGRPDRPAPGGSCSNRACPPSVDRSAESRSSAGPIATDRSVHRPVTSPDSVGSSRTRAVNIANLLTEAARRGPSTPPCVFEGRYLLRTTSSTGSRPVRQRPRLARAGRRETSSRSSSTAVRSWSSPTWGRSRRGSCRTSSTAFLQPEEVRASSPTRGRSCSSPIPAGTMLSPRLRRRWASDRAIVTGWQRDVGRRPRVRPADSPASPIGSRRSTCRPRRWRACSIRRARPASPRG